MNKFPSPEWLRAFMEQINSSPAYRGAAAAWTFGPLVLLVGGLPERGLGEVGLWLDLDRGACKDARLVSVDQAGEAPFVLGGEYRTFRELIQKRLDPVSALLERRLALTGLRTVVIRFLPAVRELLDCATRVPTRFVDG